jgi:hypothetical protein
MSLTTYAGLKSSVAAWLKRDDLTSIIPDLVTMAESRIARDLRLRRQIVSADLSLTAGTQGVDLPADWLEFENVTLAGTFPRQLTYVNIEHLDSRYPSDHLGVPAVYTLEGNQILFGPTPDSAYTVNVFYYGKFAALSADADTNWLLTNHPSIYLFATLAEAAPYVMDDERSVIWEGKYAKDMNELQNADDAAMFSGTALRVRTIN